MSHAPPSPDRVIAPLLRTRLSPAHSPTSHLLHPTSRVPQVRKWDVANVRVHTGEAAEAQEFLVQHSQRIRRLSDLQMERRLRDKKRGKTRTAAFSWIFKREVSLG